MNVQSLSPLNEQLAAELRRDAALAQARLDLRHESVPAFLHNYPYPVSAWPIFVNRQLIREQFEPLVASMPKVLRRALRARFSDNDAMAEYFGWPELICHMLEQAPSDPGDLLIRYDIVLTSGGPKLLENNYGSTAGGWQDDFFLPQMRTHLERLAQSRAWKVSYRPILHSMLKALADGIERRRPDDAHGNILVYRTFSPGEMNPDDLRDSLQSVYDAVKSPALADGRITVLREFEEIDFTAAGEVMVQGRVMDAFLLGDAMYTDLQPATLNRLIAAQLRDQLVFPDSPFHLLHGDKGMFALLHECRNACLLDDDDCALIDRYVPWSARLLDEEVLLDGAHIPLIRHLLAHKDDFVIKKFHSSGGRDVIVGRHSDADQWEQMVRDRAEPGARWIVQKFCAPSRMDLPDAALGMVSHAVILGVFSYEGEYSGAFVRGHRAGGRQGVINSATGATDVPVFEAD